MARNLIETNGIITDSKRLNNSTNGNPRFNLVIDGIMLTTKSDYAYCYNIENLINKGCKVIIKYYETKTGYRLESIKEL